VRRRARPEAAVVELGATLAEVRQAATWWFCTRLAGWQRAEVLHLWRNRRREPDPGPDDEPAGPPAPPLRDEDRVADPKLWQQV